MAEVLPTAVLLLLVTKERMSTMSAEAKKLPGRNKAPDITLKRGLAGVAAPSEGAMKKLAGKKIPKK
jgi:hypothetical protein